MILYHGSTMEVSQPRILKSEVGRDFGFAFYTTDIQAQAERWARRRANGSFAHCQRVRMGRKCRKAASVFAV